MCIYRGSILYIFITLALLAGIATISNAQSYTANTQSFHEKPRHYICFQTTGPITIDGKPGETAWRNAPWTEDFIDIEGNAKPAPLHRTRVKMLWDEQHLYIFAELEEPDVWGSLLRPDTIIFHDNDFEVFIDPDGDTHQYFEIEINALNTVMDLFLNYTAQLGSLPGTWDATAGYSYSKSYAENPWFQATGLSTDVLGGNGVTSAQVVQNGMDVQESKLISFFGRMNYNFNDRRADVVLLGRGWRDADGQEDVLLVVDLPVNVEAQPVLVA